MNQRAHAAYANTQRETAVASASPVDLVVLVFQRMLDHLQHGRQLMLDEEDSGIPLGKALQLLNGGLEACLDAEKGERSPKTSAPSTNGPTVKFCWHASAKTTNV